MNKKYQVEITMKAGLSKSFYRDCQDLDAFKRWLSVVMLLAMSRQELATENLYIPSLKEEAKHSLS